MITVTTRMMERMPGTLSAAVLYALVAVLFVPAAPVLAVVTAVDVAPVGTSASFNRPATVRVAWRVSTDAPAGTVVYSSNAVLRAADPSASVSYCSTFPKPDLPTPFGSVGGRVAATAAGTGSVTVRETVHIPASWLIWARDNGYGRLHYIRYFDDGSGQTACTVLQIRVVAGGGFGGVEFGLSYIRMRFDDGGVARIVEQGGALSVRAEVRYRGHGLLRAVWEVADPASTRSGTAVYVPLRTVHRYLTGAGRTILEGPALPTGITGLHLVRLRLIEPAIDAPNLFLRYFVRATAEPPARLAGIALRAPDPGAGLRPDTRFAWAPVADAAAYRVEFYDPPGGFGAAGAGEPPRGARPVGGMLLPGGETEAPLSGLAHSALRGPAVYLWRVVAFDAAGRPIAASPYRRVVVPADGGAGAGAGSDTGGG